MTSSAAPSYPTTRSNTLGSRELSSCSRSLRIGVRAPRSRTGRKRSRGGNATAPRPQDPTTAGASALVRAARERVGGGLRAADDGVDARLALQRALDRLLYRPVVEVEDFLVVLRLPVDEHAHQDAVVVHLVSRDDARGHAVHHRARDRGLRRAEHLHGLRGILDGDLVEEERVRLRRQVGRNDGEQLGETVGVVRQRADEGLPRVARLRPDDQIDVSDLIPVAYQRLAKEEIRCHNYLPIRMGPRVSLAGRHECGVESSVAREGLESRAVPRLRVAPTKPYRWGANLPAAPIGVKAPLSWPPACRSAPGERLVRRFVSR